MRGAVECGCGTRQNRGLLEISANAWTLGEVTGVDVEPRFGVAALEPEGRRCRDCCARARVVAIGIREGRRWLGMRSDRQRDHREDEAHHDVAGIVTIIFVPLPTAVSTSMRPPCSVTI